MTRQFVRAGVLNAAPVTVTPGTYPGFPHLTATDFGAVGDGTTDNQAALTSAFAAAKAQALPLYLPPGTYNHSAKLTLDGATLFGQSSTSTHLHGTTYANHALYLTGTGPQVHGIKKSGTNRAPRSSNREGNGIYVTNASGYVIRNCHVLNVDGAGVMTEFATFGLERNNLVELTGADGMYHTEASHDIENCYNRTVETGDDAISWTTYGQRWVYNLNIHHNTCVGNYQSRVITVNGTRGGGVTIHDNHIDGGTAGISIVAYSGWSSTAQNWDVEAYGNTIRNINQTLQNTGTIGGGAIAFWNNNAGADQGLNLHDNVVYNPGLYGIYAAGTTSITATVANTPFYLGGTLYRSDNPAAAVTRTNVPQSAVSAYPGDLVPVTVGGLDPAYQYTP